MRLLLNPCNALGWRGWKKRIGKQWTKIPSFYLENVAGPFIFDCDYDLRLLNLATCLLSGYINILKAWTEVQGLCNADIDQNNIRRLEDLLEENNSFLGYHQFWILLPSNLNVSPTSSRETLRFSGNKIRCSPRDQLLSVNYCCVKTISQKNRKHTRSGKIQSKATCYLWR